MDAEPWSSSHRFLTRIEETVAEYRSRDIHLHTHPIVLRSCEAGRLCRWTQFLSIGTPRMPYNALEWHVSVQMNVTRAGFAASYFVSYTLATGSAAYHFSQRRSRHRRRNKCPPAAKGQALRGASLKALLALDFCLFMRGHSWKSLIRCISAELLVYSIQAGISA